MIYACFYSWQIRGTAVGIPMLAVLVTVGFWYFGDVFYNDYADYCAELSTSARDQAWMEVLIFVFAFGFLTPLVHRWLNAKLLGRTSRILQFVRTGEVKKARFQIQIDRVCYALLIPWLGIMALALVRTNFDVEGLFAPFLTEYAAPWSRARLGAGYDSLLSVIDYTQIGLAAAFGVIAGVAVRPRTLITALLVCALTLPAYIFESSRGTILVTLLPGFFAFVFLRIRVHFIVRLFLLVLGFWIFQSWLLFIIDARAELTISEAFRARLAGKVINDDSGGKHAGLNMFEELCWVNTFVQNGSLPPNWGIGYLAELANPIPRVIWPGKPTLGLDYAVLRDTENETMEDVEEGQGATVSTGMIGQGVLNFGIVFGPIGAALIMSLWVSLLARQDLLEDDLWRLCLYGLGLVLTFNMGRDVTLLVTYPFVFGYLLFLVAKFFTPARNSSSTSSSGQEPHPVLRLRLANVSPNARR